MAILQGARITGSIIATQFIKASGFSGSLTASRLYVQGSVGIGTSTPGYKLQAYNSSNGTTAAFGGTAYGVRIDNGGTFSSGRSTIYGVDNTFYGSYQPLCIGASTLAFSISGTDKVTIDTAGNVGIGTSPGAILDIYKSVNSDVGPEIRLGNNGNYASNAAAITYDDTGANSGRYLRSQIKFVTEASPYYGQIQFLTGLTTLTQKVIIKGDGNVGIGTTSPATKLDVNASIVSRSTLSSPRFSSAGTYVYGVTNSPTWNQSCGSYTNNNVTAPDGTTSAGTYTFTSTCASYDMYQTITGLTVGRVYTIGMWVKLGTATNFCLVVNNSLAWNTIGGKAFTSSDGLSTGKWTHVSYTFTQPAGSNQINLHLGYHAETAVTQQTAGTVFLWNIEMTELSSTWISNVEDEIRLPGSSIWTSRGNVGIGTTNPLYRLQLGNLTSTSTATPETISLGGTFSNSAGSNVKLKVYDDGAASGGMSVSAGQMEVNTWSSGKIAFYRGTTQSAIIDANGNLGIGTSSPANKLTIQEVGTDGTPPIRLITTSAPSTFSWFMSAMNSSLTAGKNYIGLIGQAESQNNSGYIGFNYQGAGSTSNFLTFGFYQNDNLLNLRASGNVGIGTTSPSTKLDVYTNGTSNYISNRSDGTDGSIQGITFVGGIYNRAIISSVNESTNGGYLTFQTYTGGNGSERMRITSGGNVGIGTSVPVAYSGYTSLTIGGPSTIGLIKLRSSYNSGDGAEIYQNGSGHLLFNINSTTTPLYIKVDGNVGIGTTSPTQILHIVGSNAGNNGLTIQNTNASGNSQLRFLNSGGTEKAAITYIESANAMYFYTSGGGNVLNVVGGNVGIGTTSPSYKLHVSGSITAAGGSNSRFLSIVTSGTDKYFLDCYGTSGRQIFALYENSSNAYLNSWSTMAFRANQNGGSGGYFTFSGGNIGVGSTPSGILDIQSSNTGDQLVRTWNTDTSGTGKSILRIANSGNNAQGTQLQFTDLNYFVGTIATDRTNGMAFYVGQQATALVSERMRIDINGNVGIGTSSPASKLNISMAGVVANTLSLINVSSWGNNTVQLFNSNGGTTGSEVLLLGVQAGGNGNLASGFGFGRENSSDWGTYISLKTHSTSTSVQDELYERMRITAAGNVGIGTTSPVAKLDVNGTSNFAANVYHSIGGQKFFAGSGGTYAYIYTGTTALNFINGNDTSTLMTLLNGGSVGIGTTSPLTKLDVRSGYITAGTGTSTSGTTILGGYYGDGNLTILGTEYSSGGPMLGYGVTPSTTSAGAFLSSTGVNVYRSAYVQDGGTHRWYIGGVQTVAIGSAVSTSERMRINADGNLGIGTSGPLQILHVNGSILLDGVTNGYQQSATRAIGYGSNSGAVNTDGFSGMDIQSVNAPAPNGGNYSQNVRFWAHHYGTGTGNTPRMVIQYNGNVGIGTTSPVTKLQVVSDAEAALFKGTATFGSAIQIEASSTGGRIYQLQSSANGAGEGGGKLLFVDKTAAATRLTIISDGNVGIGTTDPTQKLDINGTLRIRTVSAASDANFLTIDASGNVNYRTGGANGTSGTSGANGSPGSPGSSGTTGVSGTSGTSGANGSPGSSGTTGVSGTSGVNGTSGTSGANGSPGSSGATGTSGSSGSSVGGSPVRAYVYFNGTGTVTINGSNNVTSITDNGVGDYTVNFTTAFVDAYYAVSGTCTLDFTNASSLYNVGLFVPRQANAQVAGSCRLACEYYDNTLYDCVAVRAMFVRA